MRKFIFLVAAACAFGLAPFEGRLGVAAGALLLLGLSVGLAMAASGGLFALSVASGALGAFVGGALSPVSTAVGGACLVGLAFAERTTRVRGRTARAAHVGLAVLGGALGGALAAAYASSSLAVHGVAVVVAAVLSALPLLIEADDPIAHALDSAADELSARGARDDATATALREGAELRRNAQDVPLDATTARGVRLTWKSLVRLTEARLRLEKASAVRRTRPRIDTGVETEGAPSAADAVTRMVDQRIADHVGALARAYTAVDTAHAAELGLDDAAVRSVDAVGECLEDVSRAIVEVKG